MRIRTTLLLLSSLMLVLLGCQSASEMAEPTSTPIPATETPEPTSAPTEEPTSPPEPTAEPTPIETADTPAERTSALLAEMTLAEKIGQMTLIEDETLLKAGEAVVTDYLLGGVLSGGGTRLTDNSPENWVDWVNDYQQQALDTRLSIPLLYGVDSVHGNNKADGTVIFPHNIGLGDAELVREIGRITALETRAMGPNWNYDPVMAVPLDIRWGRTYEGFSESTELVNILANAKLLGLQDGGIDNPLAMLGTPKHFVADGGAGWATANWDPGWGATPYIDRGDAQIDEETLRSVHLLPYLDAIENGAKSIMASYSSWNGMPLHAQDYLLTDVLKEELGFDGFIVSDWAAIDEVEADYYDSVVTSINAGIDMVMVPYDYEIFTSTLTEAVEAGDVAQERIDDAVTRILQVKFEMGLFDNSPIITTENLDLIATDEHKAVAREAVQKSLVLLQNEGDVLPLAKDSVLFVAGETADSIGLASGGWTIGWQGAEGGNEQFNGDTILAGIEQAGAAVYYDAAGRFRNIDAVPDACIVVLGEGTYAEWVGDSPDLELPSTETRLLNFLPDSCETIVAILVSGRPMIITEQLETTDAFVAAWYPGSEGAGVADVLFGDVPFSGTLPFTWPASVDELPYDFTQMAESSCSDGLFPFGYGLGVNEPDLQPCTP